MGDATYLADVAGAAEHASVAAQRLGAWQGMLTRGLAVPPHYLRAVIIGTEQLE
jgi:hypothetical protein